MDKFKQDLEHSKHQIDQRIAVVSTELLSDTKNTYGERYSDILAAYVDVLGRGGKRLRGVLAQHSYEFHGGKDTGVGLEAAVIIEMLHDYLLVVDDVEDVSTLRRGKPAAHILLENYHQEHHLAGDQAHYGVSQAINAALAGQNLALSRALKLPVSDAAKVAASAHLNGFLTKTCFGQLGDFNNEAFETSKEEDVVQVLKLKTAYYTFCMPVYFGAALAGRGISPELNDYLLNAGISFQLYDDIIGTFGEVEQTGKSNRSDIIEGKRTLLVVYALERATSEQKTALAQALGNKNLTDDEFEAARQAIKNTGALERCQAEVQRLTEQAKKSINQASSLPPGATEFFTRLVDYVAEHTKV
ncbi:MAG: polyprenyl synthetase family protein [Candidatus Nomurabacteria bacterium]|jgi:geranylgeranyl diphosphate synthase type I|nr:polyprenyl synthetase family protein [Candidatus Nomurabacteria bacterium]